MALVAATMEDKLDCINKDVLESQELYLEVEFNRYGVYTIPVLLAAAPLASRCYVFEELGKDRKKSLKPFQDLNLKMK